jgi:hypothetical protein
MSNCENPTFQELMWIDNHLTNDDLIKLFGLDLGTHLINKRADYTNTLYFFNCLDKSVRMILGRFAQKEVNEVNEL